MGKAEKFIEDCTRNCSNAIYDPYDTGDAITIYAPWLTPDQALRAVEIAREEMVERACKWLQSHYRVISGGEVEDFIWSLKQAMKDE